MVQTLLTALIVTGCVVYLAWSLLLPAAARRRVAQALLRRRWPDAITRRLKSQAMTASGCHCDGCERGNTVPPGQQTVLWVRRRRD
jgi:hypothetical protein